MQQIVQWFDLGGNIKIQDGTPAVKLLEEVKGIQGLLEQLGAVGVNPRDPAEMQVSAAEFLLEGLYAHKRIGRNEERLFTAGEKQPRRAEASGMRGEEPPSRNRRPFN